MKFSFNLWVLRYKRYNEVRLQRSNFAGPQHFVINVFYCIYDSYYKLKVNEHNLFNLMYFFIYHSKTLQL